MSSTDVSDHETQDRMHIPKDGRLEKRESAQVPTVGNEKETTPNAVTFPEGGGRGWAVVVGAFVAVFSTFGWVNTWGVFQEYYETHQLQHESPSSVSWIGSLQIFLQFAGMLVGGPLFDMHGEKMLWFAAPVYLFSVFMTSLCKEYYQFMLAQGILGGIGMGLTISPCFAATSHYFNKKRGAALGIVVAGSSLGGVIWPIVLNKLFHSTVSFGWSIRICAFAMVGLISISVATVKARLPPRKGTFFLPSALKNLQYDMIILASFLATIGQFVPLFYLPSYAVDHGMSTNLSFYLPSVLNATSFFGRVVPGIIADKLGPLNMLSGAAISTAILILCWTQTKTNAGVFVFTAVFGFFSGALVSLMSVAFTRIPEDPRQIGTYLGMGMTFVGFASLIGPPINGAFVSKYGSYDQAAIFSGVLCLVGGFVVLVAKWASGKGLLAKV